MKTILLGIGDMGLSNIPGNVIKTLALGSCVAVVVLHPQTRTAGMIHVALPESKIDPEKSRERPGYFADTGITALLQRMKKKGCSGSDDCFVVKLAGGASMIDIDSKFNIGARNVSAVKKELRSRGMDISAEDIGGNFYRNVEVDVDQGSVNITSVNTGRRSL